MTRMLFLRLKLAGRSADGTAGHHKLTKRQYNKILLVQEYVEAVSMSRSLM